MSVPTSSTATETSTGAVLPPFTLFSTRVSHVADLAGRAGLVLFFGFLATSQFMAVFTLLNDPAGPQFLDLARRVASLGFVTLIIGTTIVRLKPIRNAEGFEPRFCAVAGSFLSFALIALPQADIGAALEVTALTMVVVGWFLSASVLFWLGRAFSVTAQARRLVTVGPYAIVRHPLYLCEEIAVLGVALTHFSALAVLLVAVQWLFQLRRMANEEKVLRETFAPYAAYAARTPRIIPRPSLL